MLKLALGSITRHAGSVAAGYLAHEGIAVTTSDPTTTMVIAVGVYLAMQAWSLFHKGGKVSA